MFQRPRSVVIGTDSLRNPFPPEPQPEVPPGYYLFQVDSVHQGACKGFTVTPDGLHRQQMTMYLIRLKCDSHTRDGLSAESLELRTTNPEIAQQYLPGKQFLIQITPVE